MLGGSSLWGFGAGMTRRSRRSLARRLHERGVPAEIRNLSELGYVSTQEVIGLLRELQEGYRPDVVIFYDGVNDTTSAVLSGEAGLTTNEINRRREFNLLQSPGGSPGPWAASFSLTRARFGLRGPSEAGSGGPPGIEPPSG